MEELFEKSVKEVDSLIPLSNEEEELLHRADKAASDLFLPEFEHYIERRLDEQIPLVLSKYDLLGIPVSKEYGGSNARTIAYALAIQRFGQLGMSLVSFVSVHTSLGAMTIQQWGTQEQKREILPLLTKGKKICAFALTEPEAGSDPSSLTTKYKPRDGKFVLNGQKYLVSNGGICDLVLVFARNLSTGAVSCFMVDSKSEGFQIDMELKEKIGLPTSSTVMFSLRDCAVPRESLLGPEGRGLTLAYSSLMSGRLGVASGCLGVIDDCLNAVIERCSQRVQHGKKIGKHQLVQQHVAAICQNREMARWPTYAAALAKERYNKDPRNPELRNEADYRIALAKRISSRCADDSADRAVQVFGGFGFSTLSSPGRHYCDVRVTRIYEGTDEILDLKIARSILGPDFDAFV